MISDILINYIKNAVCRFENEIADMCRKTAEPVFLTKNGEGDLVVMDIETYNRREKMLKLREDLLAVEEDRLAGRNGCTLDELDEYLDVLLKGSPWIE